MKKLILLLAIPLLIIAKPKVLHLTFHKGTAGEIEYLCKHFGLELETWYLLGQRHGFLDGRSHPGENYVMTHDRAHRIYAKHRETFLKYDLIITSDIAPLSRIFLQHGWKKPLLVWVCNRFDMNPLRTGINQFPDPEYLELFQNAAELPNVEIVGYTNYEKYHAEAHQGILSIKQTITPTGMTDFHSGYPAVPSSVKKHKTFFIRDYINEKRLNLGRKLKKLGIKSYSGYFSGSADLAEFKGMIHVPVVMGNLQLWENLSKGIVHFIPSKRFYKELYESRQIEFWDWTSPSSTTTYIPVEEIFAYCDWYNEELAPFFVFFDSFDHLKQLVKTTDYASKRKAIKSWHKEYTHRCLSAWRPVFEKLLYRVP